MLSLPGETVAARAERKRLRDWAEGTKKAGQKPGLRPLTNRWLFGRVLIHWIMLKKSGPEQTALEMVTLDELVPHDHLLRKIDAVIDFSFVHDRVAGLYCADNGRPPLDPTVMFEALFLGYLFGIRSERQLVREIEVNVAAYRWFLRPKLRPPVFSTPRRSGQNVDGLYTADPAHTAGKNVLLFDELFRSGTTMNVITDVLLNQGQASSVRVLTITKTRSNQ